MSSTVRRRICTGSLADTGRPGFRSDRAARLLILPSGTTRSPRRTAVTPPTTRRLPRTSSRRCPRSSPESDTDLRLDADQRRGLQRTLDVHRDRHADQPRRRRPHRHRRVPGRRQSTSRLRDRTPSRPARPRARRRQPREPARASSPRPTAATATSSRVARASCNRSTAPTRAAVVTSSDPHPNVGAVIVYTATFGPVSPATATPDGGVVIFEADTTPIDGCDSVPLSGGEATCTTTASPRGTVSITAMHSATSDFNAGSSPAFVQDVGNLESTTTVSSNDLTSTFNQSVTFTATVAPVILGDPTPAGGTVSFNDDDTPLTGCETQPIAGGVATCDTADLGVGDHTITASFSGDSGYTASSSAPISQAVTKAGTSLVVTSGTNPSMFCAPTCLHGNRHLQRHHADRHRRLQDRTYDHHRLCQLSRSPRARHVRDQCAHRRRPRTSPASTPATAASRPARRPAVSQVVNQAGDDECRHLQRPDHDVRRPGHLHGHDRSRLPRDGNPVPRDRELQRRRRADRHLWRQGADRWSGHLRHDLRPGGHRRRSPPSSVVTRTSRRAPRPRSSQVVAKAATTTGARVEPQPVPLGPAVTFTATVTSTAGTPTGSVTFSRVKNDSSLKSLGTAPLASGVATFTTAALPVQNGHIVADYATTTNYLASTHNSAQTVSRS